jgi:hypothetical protein
LDGISSYVYSDHVLNLFEDISGRLPDHKNDMLSKVNRYLAMPEGDRNIFRLGRRLGYFRTLGDMNKPDAATPVTRLYEQLQVSGVAVDDYIRDAMTRFI